MQRVPMTPACHARMKQELERRKADRASISNAIEVARDHGDLKENAEYHAAKDQQGLNEAHINDLEDKLSRAEVIDPKTSSGDRVKFGATVKVADEDTDEELVYRIVGADEADIKEGLLSITSPLAQALIGKKVADSVEVATPSGAKAYEIISVKFV